jgi:hypothetical protein
VEIFVLTVWDIWRIRNEFIFKNVRPSLYKARLLFKEELKWIKFTATQKILSLICLLDR